MFDIKRQPFPVSPYCKSAMEVIVVDQYLHTNICVIALESPLGVNNPNYQRFLTVYRCSSGIQVLGESAYFLFLVPVAMLLPGFAHRLF